jgi:hypothetical protein
MRYPVDERGPTPLSLQRLDARTLDCAILPLPIDTSLYSVQQIAQSPLVVWRNNRQCFYSEGLVRKRVTVILSPGAILRDRLHRRPAFGPAGAWTFGLSLGHAGAGLVS